MRRGRFQARVRLGTESGGFEVTAITAGVGNGWRFREAALRSSLPLWEGVQCYVDHAPVGGRRSVRDWGGTFAEARWEATSQAVVLTLRPCGPAADIVAAAGLALMGEGGAEPPDVGFSADLLFDGERGEVQRIVEVLSLDLVLHPARGGAFRRVLQSEVKGMEARDMAVREQMKQAGVEEVEEAAPVQQAALSAGEVAAELRGAGLPPAVTHFVRGQLAGRAVRPDELAATLDEARGLVSALTGPEQVRGVNGGGVSAMFNEGDRLQAAVDDLLEAPRARGAEAVAAPRLGGIRELYHLLTGDYDFHGGFYGDRVQLATTADFTGLVKNALNKIVVNQWELLGAAGYDWWRKIATVEHFSSLQQVTGTLVGTVGTLPVVAEGGEYQPLAVGDSPETANFVKYGGYIPLTLELIDRDETRKLKAYPRELANAGMRRISALVAEVFTANSGAGPTLADGGALFNATAQTTAGGHKNLLTAALDAASWEAACQAVYDQPQLVKRAAGLYGVGPKLALNPRYCLVPRSLQLTARKILYPLLENAATITSQNQQMGAPGDVVTVPEWDDGNNWAAVVDPVIAPAVYVGERFGIAPEIFIAGQETSPAVFMNDEHRLKVRHFLAVWVNDYRPLHKSNVG